MYLIVTVLCINALARYWAPFSLILLHRRFSLMSVFMKRCRCLNKERKVNLGVTVFCLNESDRSCAPLLPR